MQPLLEASQETRAVNDELRLLRLANEKLEEQLREARQQLHEAQQAAKMAVRAQTRLQKMIEPWWAALSAIRGELVEMVDDPTAGTEPRVAGKHSAIWESWKTKVSPLAGKIIDTLLLHREMNTQQLAIATGTHRNSIPRAIYELNKAGLINKNSGRFSLKEL